MLLEKTVTLRRDKNLLYKLRRNLAQRRFELDNAVVGDRQNVRNVLAGDRKLLLAYQDLPTEEIIERIHQENFNCRKQLDLLHFRANQKSQSLIGSKLLAAELEDRLVYAAPGNLPVEIKCQKFTAVVQDATLKKEAAIVINEAYKKIVHVCKKDAIHFDVILESIRTDQDKQGQCMLNAIILGQLAMEYLDDRRNDFKSLERIVKTDMKERRQELDELTKSVHGSRRKLKFLIRRDSDMTLSVLRNGNSNTDIVEQLNFVCKLLDRLKQSFFANSYFSLIKCLEDQFYHRQRLQQLEEKWLNGRDILQNKIDHAYMMHDHLCYTMNETTQDYKKKKKSLLQQILKQEEKTKTCHQLHKKSWNLLTIIKVSLQRLEQQCKYVKEPVSNRRRSSVRETASHDRKLTEEVLNIKANMNEIINIVVPKLLLLSTNTVPLRDTYQKSVAQSLMEGLVVNRTKSISICEKHFSESLIQDDLTIEDASIPTRAEMKAKSRKIVLLHTVNEDLVPLFDVKSKSKRTLF